jgi:hypothetical protein
LRRAFFAAEFHARPARIRIEIEAEMLGDDLADIDFIAFENLRQIVLAGCYVALGAMSRTARPPFSWGE